jgi:hypothetical protein
MPWSHFTDKYRLDSGREWTRAGDHRRCVAAVWIRSVGGGGPPPGETPSRRVHVRDLKARATNAGPPPCTKLTCTRSTGNYTARTCVRVHATSELSPLDRCDFGQTAARPPRFVAVSPCLRGKSSFNPSARSLYAPHPSLRCRADYAPHLSPTLRARRRGLRLPGRAARS